MSAAEMSAGDFPGRWWHRLDDGRIQCDLCPRDCRLHEGQRGACFVRQRKDDALAQLRPYVDGVILERGRQRATFLPQVWEQLPEKEQFLSHLASKAGLAPEAWKSSGARVQVYQVEAFKETEK